jgi:hypothetical protein
MTGKKRLKQTGVIPEKKGAPATAQNNVSAEAVRRLVAKLKEEGTKK